MKIRAVIFDVYKTLMAVGPAPADAAQRWEALWRETFGNAPRMSLREFDAACEIAMGREHVAAKAAGVEYPESYWPAIACEVLPELAGMSAGEGDRFLYQHAQLQRSTYLVPHAVQVLESVEESDLKVGIASNAQPYTLHELDAALASGGFTRGMFDPRLTVFSYDVGFKKPSAYLFRLLGARLRAYGIAPEETLMVGDREDNDIIPAQAQGWQTVLVSGEAVKGWERVMEAIRSAKRQTL